jgi:CubicO group peptidase (beta-lactamase class C family)
MTKPIIAVAVMMLLEEGAISLLDPVSRYIPSFARIKVNTDAGLVEQNPKMDLFHLMTHTSGLGYYTAPFGQRTQTLAEAIDQIAQYPLKYQPGTDWVYSSASDVLGYVIQVAADVPLADFLEERIFKPLGMKDTGFYVPEDKRSRLAQIYKFEAPGERRIAAVGNVTVPTRCPSGGGGLVSTLADYLAFCNCLLNSGYYEGGILLSRKSIELMTTNHLPASFFPLHIGAHVQGYGFGLRVYSSLFESRLLASTGSYAWGGAAKTIFFIDPAEDFVAIFLTQVGSDIGWRFNQEIFQNLAYQTIVA